MKDNFYKIWKAELKNEKKVTDYTKKLQATINQARNEFEANKIQSTSKNKRKLWHYINFKVSKKP